MIDQLDFYHCAAILRNTNWVVDQTDITRGVWSALYKTPNPEKMYKVTLNSNVSDEHNNMNVSDASNNILFRGHVNDSNEFLLVLRLTLLNLKEWCQTINTLR